MWSEEYEKNGEQTKLQENRRRRPAPKRYNEKVEKKDERKKGAHELGNEWPRLSGGGNGEHNGVFWRVTRCQRLPSDFPGACQHKGITGCTVSK